MSERLRRLQTSSENLRQLHRIRTRHYQSEAELLKAYLNAGRSMFALPTASLLIKENGRLVLKAFCAPTSSPSRPSEFSGQLDCSWLPQELSQKTMGLTTLDPALLQHHPLYARCQVRSYLATQLRVDGVCVGLLEFVDSEPRSQPFEQHECEIVELMAAGIANSLARERDRGALRDREQKYRKLYHDTPIMLQSVDASGRLVQVSNYWLKKMGYHQTEVLGRPLTDFLTASSRRHAQQVGLPELFATGEASDVPYQFVHKNGEVLDVLLSATAEQDPQGQFVQSLAVLVDVTENRRLERELHQAQAIAQAKEAAESANRAKSRFLASISHELRTPLTSILGFGELLSLAELEPAQEQQVKAIRQAGEHLLNLINDVLDLSKIEAAQVDLVKSDFDLHRLVEEEIHNLFYQIAQTKGLALEILCDPEVPRWLYSDPMRLRQILINLVGNAIKFTESGQVLLRVSAVPQFFRAGSQPAETLLHFTVIDTGPGIEAQAIPSIFERFTQAEATIHRGGTGLGLCISRELAMLLGGQITVTSTVGVGSAFTLTLPALPADPAKTRNEGQGGEEGQGTASLLPQAIADHPAWLQQFSALPQRWLDQFYEGLKLGSSSRMEQAIDQLPGPAGRAVAIALRQRVAQYQYQELLSLFEPFCESAQPEKTPKIDG